MATDATKEQNIHQFFSVLVDVFKWVIQDVKLLRDQKHLAACHLFESILFHERGFHVKIPYVSDIFFRMVSEKAGPELHGSEIFQRNCQNVPGTAGSAAGVAAASAACI